MKKRKREKEIGKIEFNAYLPPIQTAISFHGQGDGGRVILEVPPQDLKAVLELQKLAGKVFKVKIEPGDE
ncbi:unnamed protein product [marine sediment metagenome]|uniref:Uncharacterized protein n=1 Tax=marine sediment metagenome TaxID=412755 RepID=X1V6L0_9ZZZZ